MLRKIRKASAGGAAGFVWENDGDVIEIPIELASELLQILPDDFSEVPDDEAPAQDEPIPKSKRTKAVAETE